MTRINITFKRPVNREYETVMAASMNSVSLKSRSILTIYRQLKICRRCLSSTSIRNKGLVIGVYKDDKKDDITFTPGAQYFDNQTGGKIKQALKVCGKKLKTGKNRVLYDINDEYTSVAVVNLGKHGVKFNKHEELEEGKENIRAAVAGGVSVLRDVGEEQVQVDPCGDARAAAEGSVLKLFSYDDLKGKDNKKDKMKVDLYSVEENSDNQESWKKGVILGNSQNFARLLMETPANKMTPSIFANTVQNRLGTESGVSVQIRDKYWAESKKMDAFLSVSQGSDQPPVFLEIDYNGGKEGTTPVALVGKGVTFDSGGISIKPSQDMDKMRGDMGGAACVAGTLLAAAKLKLPINIKAFIPLCENLINGRATKPGDVVTAMNGKTIQIDNTDAEGRLILADALTYADSFNPSLILDMATLTGAVDVALGSACTGVYTDSTHHWNLLHQAGGKTGDRVWRMPLFKHYSSQVTTSDLADVNNIGKYSRSGGSCTAAAFLKEFVENKNWLHLDIAGVMMNKDEVAYLGKGMSGRPTRTIVEFLSLLSQNK
ncbi:hypothetical protein LOTGIDRAFT_231435 [Lottia gigantea]|uniref:Cytosol aminopeptidase n=1 Tax=Lottia gigantea TaxID=225164 RepID=V4AML6_LOTGI|nr:hypothetical protein LOTGIDRAFT_231435 [Lottia gigantea]ESO98387.1 hypothetical protein LOTGIDRAFT_231435 [Lottia gigantea]